MTRASVVVRAVAITDDAGVGGRRHLRKRHLSEAQSFHSEIIIGRISLKWVVSVV